MSKKTQNGYFWGKIEMHLIPKESNKSWKIRLKNHNNQAKHFYKNHYRNFKIQ